MHKGQIPSQDDHSRRDTGFVKDNVQGGSCTKLPLMAKVQLGAYALFLLTTALSFFSLSIYYLGELDARFKWLNFSIFNRPVFAVIRDCGIVSDIVLILIFIGFRRSFGQTAPQLLEYLENCGKKRPDRGGDRFQ